jgi:hypothetical protein
MITLLTSASFGSDIRLEVPGAGEVIPDADVTDVRGSGDLETNICPE